MSPAVQNRTVKIYESLQLHPIALEHLVPALMKFYTGKHSNKYTHVIIWTYIFWQSVVEKFWSHYWVMYQLNLLLFECKNITTTINTLLGGSHINIYILNCHCQMCGNFRVFEPLFWVHYVQVPLQYTVNNFKFQEIQAQGNLALHIHGWEMIGSFDLPFAYFA